MNYLLKSLKLAFFIVALFAPSLSDAYTEREKGLYKLIRCMACDGQSIIGSEAEFAKSMREYISEQMESGSSDEEIVSQIRQIYGDGIFFDPPYEKATYVLWFFPVFVLIMGILVVVFVQKKYKPES